MQYPLTLTPDENGTIIAQAVDVPGALTVGKDEADAIVQAADALITLFVYFMAEGEPIPPPSRPKRGQPCAVLPPMVAAKLAIYQAMRAAGLTQAALAERARLRSAAGAPAARPRPPLAPRPARGGARRARQASGARGAGRRLILDLG